VRVLAILRMASTRFLRLPSLPIGRQKQR
jgi:hypothetical protein